MRDELLPERDELRGVRSLGEPRVTVRQLFTEAANRLGHPDDRRQPLPYSVGEGQQLFEILRGPILSII